MKFVISKLVQLIVELCTKGGPFANLLRQSTAETLSCSSSTEKAIADKFNDNIQMTATILAILSAIATGCVAGIFICGGVPIMDLSALATIWAVPLVNQKLFVMFIYACACLAFCVPLRFACLCIVAACCFIFT